LFGGLHWIILSLQPLSERMFFKIIQKVLQKNLIGFIFASPILADWFLFFDRFKSK